MNPGPNGDRTPVRIAFLGDTLLGGEADAVLARRGYEYALRGVRPLLDGVDLVVANHEGPLTDWNQLHEKSDTGRKRYWYRGRPEAAQALRELGVGVVSLANNHVLDFGLRGLTDTIAALESQGIAHCGAGLDARQARQAAVLNIRGHRLAFVSYMQRYDVYVRERIYASGGRGGCARLRKRTAQEDLAALEDVADLRIVLAHWGRNYRSLSGRQQRLGAVLTDAGADVVVGHHPHVVQRVDVDGGKPILYSLGNGLLGTPGRFHSGRPPYGMVAILGLDASSRPSSLELRLIEVDNARVAFSPVPAESETARDLLRSLTSPDQGWNESGGALRLDLDGRSASDDEKCW